MRVCIALRKSVDAIESDYISLRGNVKGNDIAIF